MQIGKQDILWNYGATFLKIASSAILLPLILKLMPSGIVGIWTVFMTITAFTLLLDFGFGPSFTRNVTYIFSGSTTLLKSGYETVTNATETDYSLLKGIIQAMRWFYFRMSAMLLVLLAVPGTLYIKLLLKDYSGDSAEVYIAWTILCFINTYNLYTYYYDSLLQGRGLIKKAKQILVISQVVYLVLASILILMGKGLIAIVSSQAISVIVARLLSHHYFFSPDLKKRLSEVESQEVKSVIDAIVPNAVKIGLTSLGGFMVQRSSLIVGSLFLPLNSIASYGISMQLIAVISAVSSIYIATYQPRIAHLRIADQTPEIRKIFLKGLRIMVVTYLILGPMLVVLGDKVLSLIGSQTFLLPTSLFSLALLTSLLETNLGISGNILLTKNIVPFFRASLISGSAIILGMILLFKTTNGGMFILVAVPLVVDIAYQAWKWPAEAFKDLGVKIRG